MQRSAPEAVPLFTNSLDFNEGINASDFDFNFEGGFEVGVTRHDVCCNTDLEAKFAMIDGWNEIATAATSGIATRIHTTPPIDIGGAADITAGYSSELINLEVNARRRCGCLPRLNWLAGFRYVELDERLEAVLTTVTPFTHETNTRNRLYGFQLGTDLDLLGTTSRTASEQSAACLTGCRWRLGGFAKAGIFGNAAGQSSSVGLLGQPPTAIALDRASTTSFIGESGLSAGWRLCNGLEFRADYRVMWIEGVNLASEQLAATNYLLTPGRGIDTTGGVLYHGLFLGGDWSF
jgi:hypothetical protein